MRIKSRLQLVTLLSSRTASASKTCWAFCGPTLTHSANLFTNRPFRSYTTQTQEADSHTSRQEPNQATVIKLLNDLTSQFPSMPDKPPGSSLSVEESRAKLRQQFEDFSGDRYAEGWDDLWKKGDFLPWDRRAPSPALVDTLTNGRNLIGNAMLDDGSQRRRKRALVPGCGRGPDVLLLQSFGYDVTGLEISLKAVEEATRFGDENEDEYIVVNEEIGKGKRQYVHGDFFKDDWLEKAGLSKDEKFELIYDYTFFCAMNPAMRPAWAKRHSQLLSPSAFANLICLEFPTTKPVSAGGPPFSSPSKAYMEHLSHPGHEVGYTEEGEVKVNPFVAISPGGLERLAHFHPPDTHAIGKDADGNVVDYISIWRHRY